MSLNWKCVSLLSSFRLIYNFAGLYVEVYQRSTYVSSISNKIDHCFENIRLQAISESMDTNQSTPIVASATGKVYKVPNRLGRGVPEVTDVYTKKCSCNREKTIVFCRACGYYCNGRIRLKCGVHPRVTFLLDIAECPRCHSAVFLDEYIG